MVTFSRALKSRRRSNAGAGSASAGMAASTVRFAEGSRHVSIPIAALQFLNRRAHRQVAAAIKAIDHPIYGTAAGFALVSVTPIKSHSPRSLNACSIASARASSISLPISVSKITGRPRNRRSQSVRRRSVTAAFVLTLSLAAVDQHIARSKARGLGWIRVRYPRCMPGSKTSSSMLLSPMRDRYLEYWPCYARAFRRKLVRRRKSDLSIVQQIRHEAFDRIRG